MGKVKLAICMEDETYQNRLVKCLMNHYDGRYELHIFKNPQELLEACDCDYAGFLIEDMVLEKLEWSAQRRSHTFVLNESNKYQEVHALMEEVEGVLEYFPAVSSDISGRQSQIMGVYSFTLPHLQIPLAALLAGLYAEQGKTIVVDMQANSGFYPVNQTSEGRLGMEDVLAMAMSGEFGRSRVLSAIGRNKVWDYIYPVKNVRCLEEVNTKMMLDMMDFLIGDMGYQTIIFNISERVFCDTEWLKSCESIYLLYPKGDAGFWRERAYVDELERRGQSAMLRRVCRIEIPSNLNTDGGWENLVEHWRWNGFGDYVRKTIREAKSHG